MTPRIGFIARLALFAIHVAVPPLSAQRPKPGTDSLARTVANIREALIAFTRADRELLPAEGVSTLRAADDEILGRRAIARAGIGAGLDTLLAAGPAGRIAIRSLAADWPGADQVRRAEVRAAFRADDSADALRSVTLLADAAPRDTQLLTWRADALESLGRAADAMRARQARFELAPEDEGSWRILMNAHDAAGTLPRLRESLGRLRLLHPESRAVREHEIEVLHRLGRREEAARIAADTTEGKPR